MLDISISERLLLEMKQSDHRLNVLNVFFLLFFSMIYERLVCDECHRGQRDTGRTDITDLWLRHEC